MPPRDPAPLRLRDALVLGVVQGPTELLPVSSSAHATLVPLLLGWPCARLNGEQRKSLELALHAGAGAALAVDMRRELLDAVRSLDRRRFGVIVLSLAPPALIGLVLRTPIERHLGGARSIAAGLALGGVAMGLADAAAPHDGRTEDDAHCSDGLALGIAQAAALIPGVSRYGATLTAARVRGFARADAQQLSWHAALPVMLGASALEGARLIARGAPSNITAPLAVGATSAFASTSLSARLLRRPGRALRSLVPFALYRVLVAAALLVRGRRAMRAQ